MAASLSHGWPCLAIAARCASTVDTPSQGGHGPVVNNLRERTGLSVTRRPGHTLNVLTLGNEETSPIARIFGERPPPRAVLEGPGCRAAIGTLLFGEDDPCDPTVREGYFDRLEDAWAWLGTKLDEPRDTPLHCAVRADDLAAVEDLLASGAAPDARNDMLEAPLHLARSAAVAKRLLERGADVEVRSCFVQTPLHVAQNAAIARLLLDAGADPDARDLAGDTPWSRAQEPELQRLLAAAEPRRARRRSRARASGLEEESHG